jgi:asparagine synthase (glutamine-hydrolysing)
MCGFAGFIENSLRSNISFEEQLKKMSSAIGHRGPDDSGMWTDLDSRIGLVHNRLSIIDLTDAGRQPMKSDSDRYIIVFNGEIYNHLDIRKKIQRHIINKSWKGQSDTETLLEAFEQWGIENTLTKLRGMFAIALWDKTEKNFYLITQIHNF